MALARHARSLAFALSLFTTPHAFGDVIYTQPNLGLPYIFGFVRVGTTALSTLTQVGTTVRRNTAGAVSTTINFSTGTGAFAGGGGGSTINAPFSLIPLTGTFVSSNDFTFTPTSRGQQIYNGTVTATNSTSPSKSFTVQGTGVAPIYSGTTANNGLFDFGSVYEGTLNTQVLGIDNTSPDAFPLLGLNGTDARTRLTLTGFSIVGDSAFTFTLTPGTTIDQSGLALNLDINFQPFGYGIHQAILNVFTDEGAALGGNGTVYTYNLSGVSIPEPATVSLTLAGLALLLASRKRKI